MTANKMECYSVCDHSSCVVSDLFGSAVICGDFWIPNHRHNVVSHAAKLGRGFLNYVRTRPIIERNIQHQLQQTCVRQPSD